MCNHYDLKSSRGSTCSSTSSSDIDTVDNDGDESFMEEEFNFRVREWCEKSRFLSGRRKEENRQVNDDTRSMPVNIPVRRRSVKKTAVYDSFAHYYDEDLFLWEWNEAKTALRRGRDNRITASNAAIKALSPQQTMAHKNELQTEPQNSDMPFAIDL